MRIQICLDGLPSPIFAPSGEYAWSVSAVKKIMDQATLNSWIVLGGDVITQEGNYTYDSWYYNIDPNISPMDNSALSITECLSYIENYSNRNHGSFYYVLVLSSMT